MFDLIKQFFEFAVKEKKWWMIPLILILILFGIFLIFSASSPLAPFLYPLF